MVANRARILCLLAAAVMLLLAGCQSEPVRELQRTFNDLFAHKGEAALAKGLRDYDDGHYAQSARSLQLALEQGLSNADRVKAHKYLAFINCADGRVGPCRDEFRAALEIDPSMQLAPAEAGHPVWGPVFRSVKGGR
ncbi:MAG TPA: TssQ family T6SS-associated lipoprotein [Burkholderiales bacterium]|nr:TssQ family T6SS-associated lipoprotein [Burkholderiales bacterium]HYA46823.1 TssQ family T6SS-associated lipoprotein [Burkholderiales bacterium]